jgi:hypothetical protein
MTILYQNISTLIPFNIDALIDASKINVPKDNQCSDQFVHKETLPVDVINEKFLDFLKSKNINLDKVVIWHWICKDPEWAHIDCNSTGSIQPCAINWTINSNKSQVNFYNLSNIDKTIRFGNEIDTGWQTDNVTAYIPINVKGLVPDAVWNDRGPALINTSVPHLIVAPEMRTSISLGISSPVPTIDEVLKKLML